jgi:uncharacterized membrane protein YidH (DUF202 family)
MIPTTLSGLILFLIFLIPGFAFALNRERHRPTRKLSAFRETALTVFTSAVALAIGLMLAIVVACFDPWVRENLMLAVRDPTVFSQDHPFRSSIAVLLFLVGATVVSLFVGSSRFQRLIHWLRRKWSSLRRQEPGEYTDPMGSSWWVAFTTRPDLDKILSIQLTDGTWVGGTLLSWSRQAEEDSNRDLTLQGPIFVRSAAARKATEIPDAGSLVISAGQIAFMTVTHRSR